MRKIFTFFIALLCAGTMFAGNGALKGAFTINAEGDIIQFSQGNLQYVASSDTWQFATNQYDVIGNAVGNTTAEEDRATQSDPIDLFGWGTGSNPTTVSNNDADYSTFTDWGTNPISNGGNKANAWRTLTKDEWLYLFCGRPEADKLFGLGKVLGKEGVIILPDDWQLPAGATFNPSTSNGLTFNGTDTYTNAGNNNYTHNTYASAEAWAKMEAAGAVFLPAAGFRSGTTVDNLTDGNYWSSTEYDGDDQFTHELYFTTKYCAPQSYDHRRKGYAVRLVRTFKPDAGDQAIIDGVKYQFVMKPGELVVFVPAQPWTEETLTIPDSVEYYGKKYEVYYIYSNAFQGNTNIKTVNLSPYKIWANAFENCTNLTTVNLNEGVDEINQFAFNNIGATSLHLPKSARLLDNTSGSPFSNNKFTEITVEEGNPYLMVGEDGALYTNPANHWRYALVAFPYASSKPFAEVPEGVSIVLENAFSGCLNMADTIILPESLKTANYSFEFTKVKCAIINSKQLSGTSNRIFWFADELEEVIFGKSVEKLSNMMFYGCDAINKITIQGEIMPDWNATHTSGSCPFDDDVITNAKLYVNCGWGESYKADDNKWGEFTPTNIIDTLMYDVQIVADKGTLTITGPTDCNKVSVSISGLPDEGSFFDKWSNGETANPATFTITSDTIITALFRGPIVGDTIEVAGVKYEVHNVNPGSEQVYVVKQDYTGTSLVIPASIEYYGKTFRVYMVNQDAFRSNTNITSVDIACNTIWSHAFGNCANLETITLHEGVREIRFGAFNSLPKAKTVEIPATVNYIAGSGRASYDAVSPFGRNSFETITVAEGNQWYKIAEDGALYTMNGEKLIAFPNASPDKRIGVIPEGVKEIVNEAFYQTPMADTVVLPTTLEKCPRILASAGAKCAIINSPCNSDFHYTFYYLNNLQEVILGPKCKYLGSKMFYNSGNIRKITVLSDTIPEWRYKVGESDCPFNGSPLTDAKVYVRCGMGDTFRANTNKWASFTHIIDTLLYDVKVEAEKGTAWISSIVDCNTRKVSISGIPYGYTFVKWNNGETTTTATYTITSDTVIRAYVKKNLLISDTFKSETVEGVPVTYKILKKSKDNGEFTVQVGVDDYYTQAISKDYAGTLTIPDSAVYYDEKYAVVRVGHYAFLRCNVTNVILPDGITEIGNDAFGYTKITSMEMPNSVTTLGSEAFYECRDLASLTLSSNLTEIPQRGFSYCSITEINIPASVEYLYERAFAGCTNLATVTWHPENLKQIGSRPFQNTPWFEAYPAEENGAKYAGDKLLGGSNDDITSLTIKEGTKMIATNAAELFYNLTDIYVPSSVESIGWGAFYDAKLERCTLNIVTPPTLFSGSNKVWDNGVKAKELFNPTYYYKVLVYVPKEAVNTYKEHAKWTEMADNIRPIGGWTVEFKDHNGNNIIDPQQVEQGERPAVIPTEVDTYYTNDYMYVFANDWDTAIVNIGDTIYSAKYIQNELPEYKVHWLTAEGGEEISWTRFQHGHSAEAKGAEKAAELDVPACMQFDTWSADLSSITEEIFVYPIWKDAAYTVIFKDGLTDEIIITKYNRECHEDVDAPAAPEHAGYTFTGWDSDAYKNVTSDLTITALYEESVATGMGNMEDAEIRIQKVIRDGQLLIIRDEKVYNVMGELVN